jgi:hypothetical protein
MRTNALVASAYTVHLARNGPSKLLEEKDRPKEEFIAVLAPNYVTLAAIRAAADGVDPRQRLLSSAVTGGQTRSSASPAPEKPALTPA